MKKPKKRVKKNRTAVPTPSSTPTPSAAVEAEKDWRDHLVWVFAGLILVQIGLAGMSFGTLLNPWLTFGFGVGHGASAGLSKGNKYSGLAWFACILNILLFLTGAGIGQFSAKKEAQKAPPVAQMESKEVAIPLKDFNGRYWELALPPETAFLSFSQKMVGTLDPFPISFLGEENGKAFKTEVNPFEGKYRSGGSGGKEGYLKSGYPQTWVPSAPVGTLVVCLKGQISQSTCVDPANQLPSGFAGQPVWLVPNNSPGGVIEINSGVNDEILVYIRVKK